MSDEAGPSTRIPELRLAARFVLWIAVPVVSWAIVGNLLETTVAVFTTRRGRCSCCARRCADSA